MSSVANNMYQALQRDPRDEQLKEALVHLEKSAVAFEAAKMYNQVEEINQVVASLASRVQMVKSASTQPKVSAYEIKSAVKNLQHLLDG